jgi:hypothetical protein
MTTAEEKAYKAGYIRGARDSEDYDHDAFKMAQHRWESYLEQLILRGDGTDGPIPCTQFKPKTLCRCDACESWRKS